MSNNKISWHVGIDFWSDMSDDTCTCYGGNTLVLHYEDRHGDKVTKVFYNDKMIAKKLIYKDKLKNDSWIGFYMIRAGFMDNKIRRRLNGIANNIRVGWLTIPYHFKLNKGVLYCNSCIVNDIDDWYSTPIYEED